MRTNAHKSEQKMHAAPAQVGAQQLSSRHQAAKDWFVKTGTSVTQWAEGHGFNARLVHHILNGRPAHRGQSHRIAVMLGIKDAPPTDVGPVVKAPSAKAKKGGRK